MEPNSYFEKMKSEISSIEIKRLESIENTVSNQIKKADILGQEKFQKELTFVKETVQKEILCIKNGFDRYVEYDAITKFVNDVKPKNSIKAIDLKNYSRVIPDINAEDIMRAKNLKIFDGFCIVFTDLQNEASVSKEDQKFIERNRDPIVFGYFIDEDLDKKHNRFYVITDWEDEFCELTFDKMINQLPDSKHGKLNSDIIAKFVSDKQPSMLQVLKNVFIGK